MTIIEILEAPTDQVFDILMKELRELYEDKMYTDGENFLVFEGTNPIALVAHIDTIRRTHVNLKINRNVVTNPGTILGADDRAGIYGIVNAAEQAYSQGAPLPTLIFTNYEESGGRGVQALMDCKRFSAKGINLFVEMDRKGCNEFVFYSWELPVEVQLYTESFGWQENTGSYSDIMDISNETKVPSINVSCGYYDQHTQFESLHLDELDLCITRVAKMLLDPMTELYEVEGYDYLHGGYGLGKHGSIADGYFGKNFAPTSIKSGKGGSYTSTKVSGVTTLKPLRQEDDEEDDDSLEELEEIKNEIFLALVDGDNVDKFAAILSEDAMDLLYWLEQEFKDEKECVEEWRYWNVFIEIWHRLMI